MYTYVHLLLTPSTSLYLLCILTVICYRPIYLSFSYTGLPIRLSTLHAHLGRLTVLLVQARPKSVYPLRNLYYGMPSRILNTHGESNQLTDVFSFTGPTDGTSTLQPPSRMHTPFGFSCHIHRGLFLATLLLPWVAVLQNSCFSRKQASQPTCQSCNQQLRVISILTQTSRF